MNEFVDRALGFIGRGGRYTALEPLITDFCATIEGFGFTRFMMTRMPTISENPEPLIIAHTWANDWIARYRTENYFYVDPVTAWMFQASKPFRWLEAQDGDRTCVAKQLASEAQSFGMVDGIGFPMGHMIQSRSAVSIAADKPIDLSEAGCELVHLVALCCEARANQIIERNRIKTPLTPREREILQWIVAGKSTWATAKILNIAESTVASHLAHIRVKLDASTTLQAVARALASGQIHL
jgi:LuxR family transcriptional regulator, quorum-sensing system regulator BjaR1